MKKELTDREKISNGECVSPRGVDRCSCCIDMCDAAHWKNELNRALKVAGIKQMEY